MPFHRSLAVLLLVLSLSGGALAQQAPIALDDEAIFAAVEDALHGTRSLAAANITVRSRDGYITLKGVAPTLDDVATAGRLAAGVRGVTGVSNQIRVADRASHA